MENSKKCRFIRLDGVIYVPSPTSWLAGWARQRWLESHFGNKSQIRNVGVEVWTDMVQDNEVFILAESHGEYLEMSLDKFRNSGKPASEKKYSTYFCDIDGTIFKYRKFETYVSSQAELTPGSLEKLRRIKESGHMIVLTTARPESLRDHTILELETNGIPYDRLLMGLERGPRHLINDMDPSKPGQRALAWNLIRDQGMDIVDV